MTVLEALLLGILQGATEFLPVSSSGHLVIGQAMLGIRLPGVFFEVAVHVATLLSVVVVYRHRVAGLAVGAARGEGDARRYLALLAVGTLPIAAAGLALKGAVEEIFEEPPLVALALVVTGLLLWTTKWTAPRARGARVSWRDAVLIGVVQAGALVPGISRSGATVAMALFLGIRTDRAAEFSFLLAVPAILGAAILQLPGFIAGETGVTPAGAAAGFAAAAVTGVLAIWSFLALLRAHVFHRFALYCWAVGGFLLLYLGLAVR